MIQVTQNGIELLAHFLSKINTYFNTIDIKISPHGISLSGLAIDKTTSLLCRIHDSNFINLPNEIITTRIDTKYLSSIFKKAKQFDNVSLDASNNSITCILAKDKLKATTTIPFILMENPYKELSIEPIYKQDHFEFQMNDIKSFNDNILPMFDGYLGSDGCFSIEKISDQIAITSEIDRNSNNIMIPTTFLQGYKDEKPNDLDGQIYFNHAKFRSFIKLIKDDEVTFLVVPDVLMMIHQVSDDYELAMGIGGQAKPYQSEDSLDVSDWDGRPDEEYDYDEE